MNRQPHNLTQAILLAALREDNPDYWVETQNDRDGGWRINVNQVASVEQATGRAPGPDDYERVSLVADPDGRLIVFTQLVLVRRARRRSPLPQLQVPDLKLDLCEPDSLERIANYLSGRSVRLDLEAHA